MKFKDLTQKEKLKILQDYSLEFCGIKIIDITNIELFVAIWDMKCGINNG